MAGAAKTYDFGVELLQFCILLIRTPKCVVGHVSFYFGRFARILCSLVEAND